MRKIFSAALALVCIWFATPALANCNLFDPSAVPSAYFATQGDGTVSNTRTDTRTSFRIQTNITANGTNRALFYGDLETPGNYVKTFTIPEGTTSFIIKHNGTTQDIFLWSPNASVLAPGTYTLSFDILSSNPSVVGGLQLKNIQIERGSAATPYTLYNPLCATCNGTIVNYVSATGTVSQSGTPTPDNPIEPTFYKQGNMVLRKVGDYADSYDATTGKITRRVGVKVLDGTENWWVSAGQGNVAGILVAAQKSVISNIATDADYTNYICSHLRVAGNDAENTLAITNATYGFRVGLNTSIITNTSEKVAQVRQYCADQYAAGTPVTVWYPLAEPVEEDWPASYCETPIKIATTKYNETKFSPLNAALANAISVVDTVVSNTITQAGRIATLQTQKQTRPNDIADDSEKCPAGKKCLLVEDASGIPHWYEIVTGRLPDGYTELEYIESTGTQYIDTGVKPNDVDYIIADFQYTNTELIASAIIAAASNSIYNYFGEHTAFSGFGENWGNSSTWKKFDIAHNTNRHIWKADLSNSSEGIVKFYLDENLVTTQTSAQNSDANFTISSLAFASLRSTKGKYYSVKFEKNNALIRDFIPALNPDGKIGMYDTVNGVFYENKGTGTFIGGQPVFN